MDIEWTPKLRQLLGSGVQVPLDGDEDAAIDDVARQLNDAGIEPDRDQVTTIVREERSKRTSG